MPEYHESLDEQFFDGDAVSSSIAIFSYEPAPPEDVGIFTPGYKKLENRDERKKEVTPTPPGKEVEDKKEEHGRVPFHHGQWPAWLIIFGAYLTALLGHPQEADREDALSYLEQVDPHNDHGMAVWRKGGRSRGPCWAL